MHASIVCWSSCSMKGTGQVVHASIVCWSSCSMKSTKVNEVRLCMLLLFAGLVAA